MEIKYASQLEPFKVMKKHFKTKRDKEYIANIYNIIKKNNPNYTDKEVVNLCSQISKSGCTYASIANAIMEQFNNNIEYLEEKLGYSFTNNNGIVECDKLMVDIFSSISNMIELEYFKYEIYSFSSIKEAYENIINKTYIDDSSASIELYNNGIIPDGFSNDGKLLFKNIKKINKEYFIGTYEEIAYKLFGINSKVNKDQLENLLKENGYNYKIKNDKSYSKFCGLGKIQTNNINIWLNKFFARKNINLYIDVDFVNNNDTSYEEFIELINDKLRNNYSILVSSIRDSEIWMTDGKSWDKPSSFEAGHQMNFNGFDKEGNIILCSWGKNYIVPQEFFDRLEFISIKLPEIINNKIR